MANTVRIEKLCPAVFGISDRRYRQLAKEGIVPPIEDGLVDFVAATKHLIAYYQKLVEGQGAITLTEERARLTRYMAEKARMELEKLGGALVDMAEVEKTWTAMGQACRSRLLSIPVKVAPLVVGRTLNEIKDLLDRTICEALDELSADLSGERIEVEESNPVTVEREMKKSVRQRSKASVLHKGKCEICGRTIDKRAKRCRRCAGEMNVKKRKDKKQGKSE